MPLKAPTMKFSKAKISSKYMIVALQARRVDKKINLMINLNPKQE